LHFRDRALATETGEDVRELAIKADPAGAAATVKVEEGLTPALDAAAEAADSRHAFLRRAWFAAAPSHAPVTLVARRPGGTVVAAIPVGRAGPKIAGLRAVPGCYWPYRSFPVAADAEDAEIAALLSDPAARRALGPAWRLGPVYADDPTLARLRRAAPAGGWTILERRLGSAFRFDMAALRAAGQWPRTSTLRKNRYFEKHLSSAGPLDFQFVTGSGWTADVFDTLASVEANSWIPAETGGADAKFLAPHHRAVWEAAAQDPKLAAMLHAAILTIGGRPAAFAFDLDCGAVKYAIANSYDEAFAQHSPGRVLAYRSLPAAAERGIEEVDWGAGDSGYKRTLGAVEGPAILDLLLVRSPLAAAVMRPLWSRRH
jgi:CelD/BcsL family acetyltransferase involved in cellulose biosynthesis